MSVFSQISSAEEDRETEGRGGQGMAGWRGRGKGGGVNKRRLALNLIRIEPAESRTLREMNCEE